MEKIVSDIPMSPLLADSSIATNRGYLRVRRVFEVLLIIAFLPILAPIVAIISLIVAFDSGLPVFYFQDRPGKNGKMFKIVKFRTMRHSRVEDCKLTDDDDPRVTRRGRFLRRHRLDELPQFWNVLMGDMSIIGPRPEPHFTAKEFSRTVPNWNLRYAVAPGITGWQQVNQGHVNTLEETCIRVEYDLYYISHASFLFDCKIVLMTVMTMVRGVNSR